jgi:hypothetical protein
MTRRIVEKHGGSIAARNQEIGGLVVTMLFPFGETSTAELQRSLDLRQTGIGVPRAEHHGSPVR